MSDPIPTDAELVRRIHSFPGWHYEFDLRGNKTPLFSPHLANRQRQRQSYFFDPLVDLFGGSLAGRRVLDLGCNAGYWSLCAHDSGADFTLGIDGRQSNIDQANLVFEVRGVDPGRYQFLCANVFDALREPIGSFDIVLCLGLLYHVSKPMELLELISRLNTDVLLIDTQLSLKRGSLLEVRRESIEKPRNAADYEVVMVPTRDALTAMVDQFGYQVAILKPQFSDYRGAYAYQYGRWRAMVCAKQTDLRALRVPLESSSGWRTQEARLVSRVRSHRLARPTGILVLRALNRWRRLRIGARTLLRSLYHTS